MYQSLNQLNTSRIELEGYLYHMCGLIFKKWHKRYYSLEGYKIFLYSSKDELEHLDFIDLTEIEAIENNPPTVPNEEALLIKQHDGKSFIIKTFDPIDLPSLKKGIQDWSEYFVLKKMQSRESTQGKKSTLDTSGEIHSQNTFGQFEDNFEKESMEVELDWILDVFSNQEKSMLNSLKKIDTLKSDGFSLKQALELNQIPEKQNAFKFLEEIKREFNSIQTNIYNLLPKKIRKQQSQNTTEISNEKEDLYEDLNQEDFKSLSFRKKMSALKNVNESNEREIEDLRRKLFNSYLKNFYNQNPRKDVNLDEETLFNRIVSLQIKTDEWQDWIQKNYINFLI